MENNPLLEPLNEIRDSYLLKKVLPSSFYKSFEEKGLSLLEIIKFDPVLYSRMNGVGQKKIDEFKAFQSRFLDAEFVKLFLIEVGSYQLETKLQTCTFEEAIALYYEWDNEVDFIEILNGFAKLLCDELHKIKQSLPEGVYLKSLSRLLSYLELFYGLNSQAMHLGEMGKRFGLTDQAIRAAMFSLKEGQFNLSLFLTGQKQYFGLKVSNAFVDYIQSYLSNFSYNSLTNSVVKEISPQRVKNLITPFGYTILKQGSFEDECFILVQENNSLYYQAHITILTDLLKNGNPMSKEEIRLAFPKIVESRKRTHFTAPLLDKGECPVILDALLNNSIKIEKLSNEEGETCYRLNWPSLPSINAKVTYILYDARKAMPFKEICQKFEELNKVYNLLDDSSTIHRITSPYVESIGKLGIWRYVNDKDLKKNEKTFMEYLNEMLARRFEGKAFFDEIVSAINTDKYAGYGEKTIRAYLNTFARRAKSDSNLFIHEDFLSIYPSIEVQPVKNKYFQNTAINELVTLLREYKKLSKHELTQKVFSVMEEQGFRISHKYVLSPILAKCKGYNFIEEDQDGNYVLVNSELEKIDLLKIGLRQEPEYRTRLKSEVIEYLKSVGTASFSDIMKQFLHFLPLNIDRNNFYKVFDSDSIFTKYTVDSVLHIKLNYANPKLEIHEVVNTDAIVPLTPTHWDKELQIYKRPRYDIAKLREKIAELLAESKGFGFSKDEAMKGFDTFYQILNKNGRLSTWAEIILQFSYQVFVSGADYYDRYLCLNYLITSYETFIKRMINKNEFVSGQYDVITKIQPLHELKCYKDFPASHRVDPKKLKFSYVLNTLIFLSNKYRHDRDHESVDLPFKKDKDIILDYLGLYILTASISTVK